MSIQNPHEKLMNNQDTTSNSNFFIILKRVILVLLTFLVVAKISFSLIASWSEPQIQSRLDLYQTNLLLNAAEFQDSSSNNLPKSDLGNSPKLANAKNAIVGNEPLKTAAEQYNKVRESAVKTRDKVRSQLNKLLPINGSESEEELAQPPKELTLALTQLDTLINEIDLRSGIIEAREGKTDAAFKTWDKLKDSPLGETAKILTGIWSNPPQTSPNAEQKINQDLDSWFRDRALMQFYQVEQRQNDLLALQASTQKMAEEAIGKLALVAAMPLLGFLIGVGLLIFLVIQLLIKGKASIIAQNAELVWETPWDWETVWQVFIVGFFFIAQFIIPLFFSSLRINPAAYDVRMKALFVLLSYTLMSLAGIFVLYWSIKPFFPLPEGWFKTNWREKWYVWGIGGYCVAVPLVIVVSLLNQKLWQGQGGSNPILQIALESKDRVALAIFFVTAAIAAPIFEEILFRGFLLPSLTRYLPVWGSLVLSSLLFAIAHLSLAEVLPLTTLGIVLGVVYTRSRNLLAPMLLHSLWNSGTLLSLFLLGSSSN